MFRPATNTDININSSMTSIDEIAKHLQAEEKQKLEQLFEVIKLISQKYMIPVVNGTFNKAMPNQINIALFDGALFTNEYGRDEKENKRPVEFLKAFGALVGTNEGDYPSLNSTVVTINPSQCNSIIEGLKLLLTPSQEEAADRYNARILMKC
ncbi:MAG: hypothetical protein ACD_46C00125G0008 [uncultured bacterium]|nr:MAG: hypothetical protein ACD_46C00125G0008 [uncultured bacterium]